MRAGNWLFRLHQGCEQSVSPALYCSMVLYCQYTYALLMFVDTA